MKDRIAKSIFWAVWSRGIFQVLSFATTLIVARWLNPADYGLMALASVWITVLSMVCELGLGAAVIQFPDLEDRELNVCFYLAMSTACVIYVLMFVAAPVIATWFEAPALANVLRVAALALPIGALAIVPDGLLQKRLDLDRVMKADIAGGLVSLVVVFWMAWIGTGVWALISGSLARAVIRVVVLYRYAPWLPGIQVGSVRLREILTFSFSTFSSRTLWAVYDQSDNFVLGKVSGEVALGFYTMARDLASIPVTRIASIANQLSVPLMANLQHDTAAMRNVLLRGLRLTASVSVPVCVGLALVADDLIRIALSDKWAPIIPVVKILCGLSLIKSIDVLIAPVLRARYRTHFLMVYNLVLIVLMPVAFLVGARLGGGIGVALAWLIAYPLVMTKMATEAFHEIDLPWRAFLAQLRAPIMAAVLMSVAVLGVQFFIRGDAWGVMAVRLLLASGIGAAVYTSVLWFWGGPLKNELREVMSWVFKPRRGAAR